MNFRTPKEMQLSRWNSFLTLLIPGFLDPCRAREHKYPFPHKAANIERRNDEDEEETWYNGVQE